jgi:hypothetical protein
MYAYGDQCLISAGKLLHDNWTFIKGLLTVASGGVHWLASTLWSFLWDVALRFVWGITTWLWNAALEFVWGITDILKGTLLWSFSTARGFLQQMIAECKSAPLLGTVLASGIGVGLWRWRSAGDAQNEERPRDHLSTTTHNEQNEERPRDHFCTITQDVFEDPVQTTDGHTYERVAIEQWFETHTTSPRTGLHLASLALTPNLALRSVIQDWGS